MGKPLSKPTPTRRSLQRLVMALAWLALAGCDMPEFKRIEMVVPPERAAEARAHFECMRKSGSLMDTYCWDETKRMFGEPWEVTYRGGTEVHRVKWHNEVTELRARQNNEPKGN